MEFIEEREKEERYYIVGVHRMKICRSPGRRDTKLQDTNHVTRGSFGQRALAIRRADFLREDKIEFGAP